MYVGRRGGMHRDVTESMQRTANVCICAHQCIPWLCKASLYDILNLVLSLFCLFPFISSLVVLLAIQCSFSMHALLIIRLMTNQSPAYYMFQQQPVLHLCACLCLIRVCLDHLVTLCLPTAQPISHTQSLQCKHWCESLCGSLSVHILVFIAWYALSTVKRAWCLH